MQLKTVAEAEALVRQIKAHTYTDPTVEELRKLALHHAVIAAGLLGMLPIDHPVPVPVQLTL